MLPAPKHKGDRKPGFVMANPAPKQSERPAVSDRIRLKFSVGYAPAQKLRAQRLAPQGGTQRAKRVGWIVEPNRIRRMLALLISRRALAKRVVGLMNGEDEDTSLARKSGTGHTSTTGGDPVHTGRVAKSRQPRPATQFDALLPRRRTLDKPDERCSGVGLARLCYLGREHHLGGLALARVAGARHGPKLAGMSSGTRAGQYPGAALTGLGRSPSDRGCRYFQAW